MFGISSMVKMPGRSHSGPLPPLSAGERLLAERLEKHVRVLAGEIGERNFWKDEALQAAASYIEKNFQSFGYKTASQEFAVNWKTARNVESELGGVSKPDEIILVGGHYDSVMGSPGANDNATGTAAVLEIARLLFNRPLGRTVRFVAFANEEPPFFKSRDMGSLRYARRCRERGENIFAMFSLETLGCYSEAPKSQNYPFPLGGFYPSRGNFIGFVANIASRDLLHRSLSSFRRHTAFPSEGVSAPGWMTGIGWSDQWAFWKHAYPAVMVTDTALFRYGAYHTRWDTPEKVDYARMARVVSGLTRVIVELAGERREEDESQGP